MPGRTVSAYVSDELAESVALEARREERSPAQVAALALRFFINLPRDARASVVALDNLGTAGERRRALNEVARVLNAAEFDMTCRRMAHHSATLMPDDASEADLDATAVDLTRASSRPRG